MTTYFTPPSTEATREAMRAGKLGMIITPGQGNKLTDDVPLWCADNGAFTGAYPGDDEFIAWLKRLQPHADRCAFVAAPDVPGDHFATYARSREMMPRIRALGFPVAFVMQDGIELDHHCDMWEEFDVAFVGGTDGWRQSETAAYEIRAATDLCSWVHYGRVNSAKRLRLAQTFGCDSADGTLLVHAPDKYLPRILGWGQSVTAQGEMYTGAELINHGRDVDYTPTYLLDQWAAEQAAAAAAERQARLDEAAAAAAAQGSLFDLEV